MLSSSSCCLLVLGFMQFPIFWSEKRRRRSSRRIINSTQNGFGSSKNEE
jgi:hypothetical protein